MEEKYISKEWSGDFKVIIMIDVNKLSLYSVHWRRYAEYNSTYGSSTVFLLESRHCCYVAVFLCKKRVCVFGRGNKITSTYVT